MLDWLSLAQYVVYTVPVHLQMHTTHIISDSATQHINTSNSTRVTVKVKIT